MSDKQVLAASQNVQLDRFSRYELAIASIKCDTTEIEELSKNYGVSKKTIEATKQIALTAIQDIFSYESNLVDKKDAKKEFLELDDKLAKILYIIHCLEAKATVEQIFQYLCDIPSKLKSEEIKKLENNERTSISRNTSVLHKHGYLRKHKVTGITKKLDEYEININNVVGFRDTATLLLELLKFEGEKTDKKTVRIKNFIEYLTGGEVPKLHYFDKTDLLGCKNQPGLIDKLAQAEYLERTVNFIRVRNRVVLEQRYLELIAFAVKPEQLKYYEFKSE